MRRYVASRRRAKSRSAERRMERESLVGVVIEGRRTLEATDGTGYFRAKYAKISGRGWRVVEADPALEFLRYCGKPEDARQALSKRGFTFRWS